MNRTQYIKLRLNGQYNPIMFNFAVARGFKYSFQEFNMWLMVWHQRFSPSQINDQVAQVLAYFDSTFNVTLIEEITKEGPNRIINVV